MLSFSAHKLMGPQGVGVLVLKKKLYKLPPVKSILYGGQQEHGIRPGTVPVALVAGCGEACKISADEYQNNNLHVHEIKEKIIEELDASGLQYHINGDLNYGIDSTLNICLNGISSEALMISTKQYCGISNGSACTSKNYSASYVLVAMGISNEYIENSIRLSWGADTEIDGVVTNFRELLETAKQMLK